MIFITCLLASSHSLAVVTLRVGETNGVPPFPHTNGKQIGRTSEGIWLVAYDGKTPAGERVAFLAVSKGARPEFEGDFQPATMIAGAAAAILSMPAREARLTSFAVDRNDVLHLAWQSSEPAGIWYSRCKVGGSDVAGRIRQAENWTRADGRSTGAERVDDPETSSQLGDLVLDGEGRLWIGYSRSVKVPGGQVYRFRSDGTLASNICPSDAGEIWLAGADREGKWTRARLTDPGPYRSPVMDLDESGNLHLVFGFDVYLHYLRLPGPAVWQPGDRVDLPDAIWTMTPPTSYSVLGWGSRALVAFEKVGHVVLYAVFDGKQWSRHPLYDTTTEPCHQPILARDHHGIAWLFWVNGRRGYTFFARWLGTRFSAPYESRALPGDPFSHGEPVTGPVLGESHTVERKGASGSGSLGVALSSRETSARVYFDRVTVPDLIAKPGRRVPTPRHVVAGPIDHQLPDKRHIRDRSPT